MGLACCTAANGKELPNRRGGDNLHSNVRCSPTWSVRWENRRRVAGEMEDLSYETSHGLSRDVSVEMKGTLSSRRGNISGGESPNEIFGSPISLKSPIDEGVHVNLMSQPSDLSTESNFPIQVKNLAESPDIADLSMSKTAYSMHSSFSTPVAEPLPICHHTLPPNSTPSRRARRSPGHRLLRQISDSRILGLKSSSNYPSSEGRSSFVLSTCSHDLLTGSHGGSSDCWSMRTFSELVASSQRQRWSFDSEHMGSGLGKLSRCSSRFSYSPSLDLQTCGACSKFLTERSPWSSQRIIASNELSVVAVLVCGHVYHAECLETTTLEVEKYDPACPICMGGEKKVPKISKKASRAEVESGVKIHKISRNRVVDSYLDSDSDDFDQQKNAIQEEETPKIGPSSSTPSSSTRTFMKRHFSFGSKWSRSFSDNDSTRKKGFWRRYRKYWAP